MLPELTQEGAERLARKAAAIVQLRAVPIAGVEQSFRGPGDFAADVSEEIRSPTEKSGATLPWEKTHSLFRIRPKEVTVWAGARGSWKTMALSDVALNLAMVHRELVVFDSREMPHARQLRRIVRQAILDQSPDEAAVAAFLADLGEYFTLRDIPKPEGIGPTLAAMKHAAETLGAKHYVLDNISCVIPVGGRDSDRLAFDFISQAADLARRTGIHLHFVAHIRKPPTGSRSAPNGYEIRGTGALGDLADNIIMFDRDKREDRPPHDPELRLVVDKQRHGDWEGTIALWFDRRYLRLTPDGVSDVLPYWTRG
jgi:twinkle protein